MKNFYVTTPIYYVNDAPHIGHSYTTVLADILTRFHKIIGYQTFFLTGTDEHGQKVQRAAAKREVTPQQHVDEYYHRFEDLWKKMDIENDFFIRTTMPEHKAFVQECLQKLWDKGEIYSKEYEGWYSVGEERFFGEDELDENKCDPISHRPVEWLKEKNYFFKMGSYQQKLIDFLESHKDWIVPDYRWNEIRGFLRQPLNDLCISRPKARLSWGIPLPFDQDYVTYVWFDALLNYVSASTAFHKTYADGTPIWPATYHLIGKDILTTHSVYWPTMLMALDIPLPQHILAHGWWLVNGGDKMSKSAGNVVNPMDYMTKYGVDAFRYFLASAMVVGQDANFTHESFVRRINSDLANDLGNVLNRVHRLVLTNFEDAAPRAGDLTQLGVAQLQGIAIRMVKNFPEVFKNDAFVEAYASTSTRCVVSMAAFLEELRAQRPKIDIHQESGKYLMAFISPLDFGKIISESNTPAWQKENEKLYSHVDPSRMMNSIFNDPAYVKKNIDAGDLYSKIYEIGNSLQGSPEIAFSFEELWTPEELAARWHAQNAWWYSVLGNNPFAKKQGLENARPLLKNFLEVADKVIAADTVKPSKNAPKKTAATLRFGHDTVIFPFAVLLQLENGSMNTGIETADMENLHKVWRDYEISPMAANVQFVFYKSSKKGAPILVKVMLNEVEQKLPVTCDSAAVKNCPAAPYYRWEDVKEFYGKIATGK